MKSPGIRSELLQRNGSWFSSHPLNGYEVPLVEQQSGEVVGRQPGEGFFWFGNQGQPAGVDPAEAGLQVVHQFGIDAV